MYLLKHLTKFLVLLSNILLKINLFIEYEFMVSFGTTIALVFIINFWIIVLVLNVLNAQVCFKSFKIIKFNFEAFMEWIFNFQEEAIKYFIMNYGQHVPYLYLFVVITNVVLYLLNWSRDCLFVINSSLSFMYGIINFSIKVTANVIIEVFNETIVYFTISQFNFNWFIITYIVIMVASFNFTIIKMERHMFNINEKIVKDVKDFKLDFLVRIINLSNYL